MHTPHRSWRRWILAGGAALLLMAGQAPQATSAASSGDWPTYHGDNTRDGNDAADTGLASPTPVWHSASLDGQMYAAPVVIGTQVIAATENNTVYSINSADGSIEWSQHLGPPRTSAKQCGDISPLGITSTPVVVGNSIYVVANIQTGTSSYYFDLVSLNLATGAVNWQANVDPSDPVWASEAPSMEDRGALLASNGRIYIPMGGNYGDCGYYHGYVVSYPQSGSGGLQWWASSEVNSGDSGAAVWAAGGISQDAAGNIFVATGNSNHTSASDPYDYSDSVIRLNPTAIAAGAPADYFAPSTWYRDNAGDVDLGSTVPLQLPNERILQVGKSGMGYILNATNLGHLGGQIFSAQVCHATNDAAFGSLAYANGVAYIGCSDGMAAVQIAANGNSFSPLWYNTSTVANHPPTIAGGVVWSVSSGGGQLLGFSASTGQVVQQFAIAGSNHFTTPTAANGQLYVAAGSVLDAFGTIPPPPVNGVTLDASGQVHHFGSVASPTSGAPSFAFPIARGVAACSNHSGGYVLDGWGGIHAYGSAPALLGAAYWKGWDIARAIVVNGNCTGGYVLDGLGGVHPFGSAPPVTVTGYWPTWDIAKALVLEPGGTSGYVVDGWGGLHPFAASGTPMPAAITNGPYWPGWDIARGAALYDAGGGYILDGWGGIHAFGDAPAPTTVSAYWKGWDIARGIAVDSSNPAEGYVLDGWGGVHPFGGAAATSPPAYLPGQDVFRGIAVTP